MGVRSLIKYATLCQYMLVPVDENGLTGSAATYPEDIPNYGERGWCRCEYFIFSLWAEMQPKQQDVQLYAVLNDGRIHPYPQVNVEGAQYMPSSGKLTNPADGEAIRHIEDTIIEAYGRAIIWKACAVGGDVQLAGKMIRAVHVPALGEALAAHGVTSLNLSQNQLDNDGAKALAHMLRSNSTLMSLKHAVAIEP